jgi:hypothetical protein
MIENPEVQLQALKKGDCFMFNGEPYIVKRIYWANLGMIKRKTWVSTMKFDNHDWHSTGDITVYHISKGLYDLLIKY